MSTVERREHKRHPANVRTEMLYNGHIYHGVIENLSASGAGILSDSMKKKVDFVQYDPLELKFKSPSEEQFKIKCTIMWASYIPPDNVRCRIGLELVDRPWDAISLFL